MEQLTFAHKGNVGIVAYLLKGSINGFSDELGRKLREAHFFDKVEGPFKNLDSGEMVTLGHHQTNLARSLGLIAKTDSLNWDESLLLFIFPPESVRVGQQALEAVVPELAGKLVEH